MRVAGLVTALVAASIFATTPAAAAPPTVPASLPYQGLLLDGLGQPRTGTVDLVVRLWDAVAGGTLVYKQSFPSVALADGVFSVQLGPSGEGSDAPTNPLTTDLATALSGDAGPTAPVRFLEVTVGGDGALTRTQILASAYALRAQSAASADTATTANTAGDVVTVDGVGASFVSELFQHFAFDGANPPNDDPSEGLGDVDGDGVANFIDSDNDGDGFGDATELGQGSHINLITPNVTSVVPNQGYFADVTNVVVGGANFTSGLTVQFGSQAPTPSGITPNSFVASVGPQAIGPVSVSVTLPNGQSRTLANAFTFTNTVAHPVALVPPNVPIDVRTGTLEVVLGGIEQYGVSSSFPAVFPLESRGPDNPIGVAFDADGAVAGLRCRDTGASSCIAEVLVDSDGDDELEDETGTTIETVSLGSPEMSVAALVRDPTAGWVAGYLRYSFSADAVVAHDRNDDGDFADANEHVVVETALTSFALPTAADLAVDSAGRVAYVYNRPNLGGAQRVAWDRNGDGDFADTVDGTPELATLAAGIASCIGAAFDAADRLVVVSSTSADGTRLFRDGDGDGVLTPENLGAASAACDVANRTGQALAVAHNVPGATRLLVDANEDGDFLDAQEDISTAGTSNPLGLVLNGTNTAIIGTNLLLKFGNAN